MLNIDVTGFNVWQDNIPLFAAFAILFAFWEVFWKGIALWQAAQARHAGWFIAILLLNTVGILPIIYLVIQRDRQKLKPGT